MCDAAVAFDAQYCSRCGVELRAGTAAPRGARWYHNVWVVLFLILFVLGPFALPLIWKNPRLSHTEKLALSGVALAYLVFVGLAINRLIAGVSSSLEGFNAALTF